MFVSLEKKILFFHISKTAGTSIKLILDHLCRDGDESYKKIYHENMNHYMTRRVINRWGKWYDEDRFTHITQTDARPFFKAAKVDFSDFFCFIVVRNPYERFKSQLQYLNLLELTSIDHCIDSYEKSLDNQMSGYWFKSQIDYFRDPLTNNIHVYKYEKLHELWGKLKDYADGRPFNIYHTNRNERKHECPIEFTVNQKKRIYKLFEEEFDTFGYECGFPTASTL